MGIGDLRVAVGCALLLLAGCGGGSDGADTQDSGDTAIPTSIWLSNWLLNTTDRSDYIFESVSSQGVLEDVQLAEQQTVSGTAYVYIEASGIPEYDITITSDLVNELNARPKASTDFLGGATSVQAGQVVSFGEDIGYNSSDLNCPTTGGSGYWPPGPVCPTDQNKSEYISMEPVASSTDCETGLGRIGLMVNGTSIYNWGDGQSFGDGVWYTLAPVAEQYDVDICGGHAAQGDYHHHFYTSCLAALVGDDGNGHSPIYGFAADGYPIYGPYESAGVLAVSGWAVRDYGAATSAGGCGTAGERTCVLNDPYDISQGVDNSVTAGPDIGATVTTLSGNELDADAGFYYEDYYYAGATVTGAQLDENNGHDTGDGRDYHYHITLVEQDGKLQPSFPYTVGPRFHGDLPSNAMTSCGGGGTGGGTQPPPTPR